MKEMSENYHFGMFPFFLFHLLIVIDFEIMHVQSVITSLTIL